MGSDAADDARERLASLGEIAAEIAHELRNALAVVTASTYLAKREANQGNAPGALPHLDLIESHARAAQGIVDDLMSLARGDALGAELVALTDALEAARVDLHPPGAHWHDEVEPGLLVRAHASLLIRLLHGLYENAIQASAPRAPRVVTRARAGQGAMVIEIEDDGPGVAPEIAARVFDPLVTARPGGTGLGLSLARRIAKAHGGAIALVGGSAHGATFRIELPK